MAKNNPINSEKTEPQLFKAADKLRKNINNKQMIIYEGKKGQLEFEVRIESETVWLPREITK